LVAPEPSVLVIEDNPQNLKLVKALLSLRDLDARYATTAAEGLAMAKALAPGVILLDIQLPDADGVSVLRSLRADPVTAAVPVIAVTASAMRGDRERFLAEGFDGYLAKPIDVRTFVDSILETTAHARDSSS
jgi:two-component system cell cycle response regulator DivK